MNTIREFWKRQKHISRLAANVGLPHFLSPLSLKSVVWYSHIREWFRKEASVPLIMVGLFLTIFRTAQFTPESTLPFFAAFGAEDHSYVDTKLTF